MVKVLLDTDIPLTHGSTEDSPSPVSLSMKSCLAFSSREHPGSCGKALSWLNQNEQITPGVDDYLEAAIIKAAARKQGAILELPDCLIAAVAIRLGLPLVTGNTSDFESVQKTGARLVIENWRI